MRKFGKSKLLGSLILFSVVLVFIGINVLEAKKPDKPNKPGKEPEPEYTWQVDIPGYDYDSGVNLFGYSQDGVPEGGTYMEGVNNVRVAVSKKKGGKSAESQLLLRIHANVADGECADWGMDGPAKIGFQNLDLVPVGEMYVEEFPCFFPSYCEFKEGCYPPDDLANGVPECMQHFLENYPQPFCSTGCEIWDPDCTLDVPNCIYRYVDIRITLDLDIEAMDYDDQLAVSPAGEVWVDVINNYDLLETGYEDWHNVSGLLKRDDSVDRITVVRVDEYTWEITVGPAEFTFVEIYKGIWRNRWEYKIPYWARTPFKFVTTWTRSLQ